MAPKAQPVPSLPHQIPWMSLVVSGETADQHPNGLWCRRYPSPRPHRRSFHRDIEGSATSPLTAPSAIGETKLSNIN